MPPRIHRSGSAPGSAQGSCPRTQLVVAPPLVVQLGAASATPRALVHRPRPSPSPASSRRLCVSTCRPSGQRLSPRHRAWSPRQADAGRSPTHSVAQLLQPMQASRDPCRRKAAAVRAGVWNCEGPPAPQRHTSRGRRALLRHSAMQLDPCALGRGDLDVCVAVTGTAAYHASTRSTCTH